MEKQNNIPTLRFPEFTGEWEKKKLGEVADISSGGTPSRTNPYYWNGNIPWISTTLIDFNFIEKADEYITDEGLKKSSAKLFPKGTLLMAMYGQGKTRGKIALLNIDATTNQACGAITTNNKILNPLFAFQNISKRYDEIRDLSNQGGQENLSGGIIKGIEISFPTLPEQTKIAEFFTAIDAKIQALKTKKSTLQQYKKGVLQQLFCLNDDSENSLNNDSLDLYDENDFGGENQEKKSRQSNKSQKSRFRQEDGTEFPKWENKKLGEVLDYEQPTNYLVSSTEYEDRFETPVVTAGKTFILGYTDETNGIFKENLPVIIFDDFTTATQFVNFPFKAKSSAMKILKAKSNTNIKFIYEAMQMIDYETGGHGRHWISVFSEIEISIPSLPEQTKIANFLSSIDDKINRTENQIQQMQAWKKGLLQRMFV